MDVLRSKHLFLVLLATVFKCSSLSDNEDFDEQQFQMGKSQYDTMKRYSQMPKYSQCWTDALSNLEFGCKHLTDDMQYRLALRFTNCFLEKTGRQIYPCREDQEIKECIGEDIMKPDAYHSFTEFFTHTQNMCYFLQSQAWHSEMQSTIHHLSDNSAKVAEQLEDSSVLQANMMEKQSESLENQEILIKRGEELRNVLEISSSDVQHMVEDFKSSTNEQRQLIFEVFDKVSSLQSTVLGEFTGLYSTIFYAISVLISYLLTSTARTNGARFWLFLLMTLNIVLEKYISYLGANDTMLADGQIEEASTILYRRLWVCRKFCSSLAIVVWLTFAYRYTDYDVVNNQLLLEIKRQNAEIKYRLESSNNSPPSSTFNDSRTPNGIISKPIAECGQGDHSGFLFSDDDEGVVSNVDTHDHTSMPSLSGYEEGGESDSDDSLASSKSDHTFVLDDASDCESFISVDSRAESREGTPALVEELRYLRDSTPIRELTQSPQIGSDPNFLVPNSNNTPRKRGRPAGSKNSPAGSKNSPKVQAPTDCSYYLRSRRTKAAPQSNPVVNTESASEFGKMVKHLSQVAMRNSLKAKMTVERRNRLQEKTRGSFFSSDED